MGALILSVSLALAPIIDAEGHHSTAFDFGCTDPLYCEEFTGLPAYADAAEVLLENVACDARYAPYRCGPDYPLVTLYTAIPN